MMRGDIHYVYVDALKGRHLDALAVAIGSVGLSPTASQQRSIINGVVWPDSKPVQGPKEIRLSGLTEYRTETSKKRKSNNQDSSWFLYKESSNYC